MDDFGYTLMFAVFGAIALFLVGREVVLWYLRLNDVIRLLTSIDASLRHLSGRRAAQ